MTINISVHINDDSTYELTELFNISLAFPGAPPPRVSLAPDTAQVTILDDDGQYSKKKDDACPSQCSCVLSLLNNVEGCL